MSHTAGAFDDALVLDWSAAASPTLGDDSCWVAAGALDTRGAITTTNLSTRHETMALVDERLQRSLARGRRVLVAIDVSFGLPVGAASTLQLAGAPGWRAMWTTLAERIVDDERNANNRFAVADQLNRDAGVRCFWGRPVAPAYDRYGCLPVRDVAVAGLRPNPLPRLRRCELLAGPGVISNWMLVGRGSVGGQMLTCLPHLERLRQGRPGRVGVWPFDGLGDSGHDVVLAETWHGLFDWRADRSTCRDEAQVRTTLRTLRSLGPTGVAALLAPESLLDLGASARVEITDEEGWTLGIG